MGVAIQRFENEIGYALSGDAFDESGQVTGRYMQARGIKIRQMFLPVIGGEQVDERADQAFVPGRVTGFAEFGAAVDPEF